MKWSLHNLAPICPVPTCPQYKTRHLLPHQEAIAITILTGDSNYIYWQGGVGSAKTLLWGVLSAAFSLMIPNSRNILFRKDFGLNYETLWRYFKNAIKAACEQHIIQAEFETLWSVKKQGEYTVCTLPNGSITRCGQTKNWSEYMGPSYDLIAVSDAMENNNFGEIFHGKGVVGGLQSRLRGQASTFYRTPSGTIKDMRRFLIESNPPPNINELHTIFGREPGVRNFPGTTIPYTHIQSSAIENDHNPVTYLAEIASQHPDPDDIKRILSGKTVPYYGGKKVITSFYPEYHVDTITPDTELPLFVSIDPGLQHPACIISQIKRCAYDKEHYIRLSEISNLYNKTIYEFVELNENALIGLLQHLYLHYPEHFDYPSYNHHREALLKAQEESKLDYTLLEPYFHKIRFCIDKAGEKRHSVSRDKESDLSILLTHYGIRCKYLTKIGLEKSLERVITAFKKVCMCNIPTQLVNRDCELLIDAYSGGYRYPQRRDRTYSSTPINDHIYEDIADADRYGLENFFFSKAVDLPAYTPKPAFSDSPYQWMYREPF